MSTHVTEEQLLQYQFKLVEGLEAQAVEAHLAGCAECRGRLADLERKFKALELMRDEVPAPAELIAKVVRQVTQPAPMRMVAPWYRALWAVAAAAALVVIGLMIPWQQAPREAPALVAVSAPEAPIAEAVAKTVAPAAATDAEPARSPDESELARLRARDPFLPGSNIELNVLPTRESVQVTIYNSADLTLVRERRTLTMKKGWNWLQFMWANTLIDPTSLQLEPTKPEHRGKVTVQSLVFPPRIRELGRWLLFSEVNGPVPVEITYLTSGLSWQAFYAGTLSPDETTMHLQGYVRASNGSGEDYEEAQTRLIVGNVHLLDEIAQLARRQYAHSRPDEELGHEVDKLKETSADQFDVSEVTETLFKKMDAPVDVKKIIKEGLSEYFLYTIEGRETIRNGWSKRLPSFESDAVPVVNLYKFEEDRYGQSVMRFLSFKNDEKHKLGQTPIPGGVLKVYRDVGQASHLSYEGQSEFKYIPVGEDVELELGGVQNVVVESKVMSFRTDDFSFNRHGDVDGWVETRDIQFTVKNTREIPVKVEITRNFDTTHWSVENRGDCGDYEKVDLDTVKYTLELPPRGTRVFTQVLTTRHGRRAE
jgi:hypothetical protein